MSNLVKEFEIAQRDLGLEIITPYVLSIPNKGDIFASLLLKNFGAKNGILVISDFSLVAPFQKELTDLNYAYSTLSEPISISEKSFDRQTFIEMLSDWGWSGEPDKRPAWLLDPKDD